uniref:MABP domain-containing protein n=1 Tax=Panagrellus redivivus TaxID=6233 RepID=A0A7E4VYA9_PANRE
MGEALPIVSICVISNKEKCPTAFLPILKTHDDLSDADLWKDGGFFAFNRSVRYLCISRAIADIGNLEVVTDLLVINEKEAIPAHFISIDFTVDSNERALRRKYLCARYSPRNDAIDAVTDIIVLGKTKRPPKGYSSAGEIDGCTICYKVNPIPPTYGRLNHSHSNPGSLYPNMQQPTRGPVAALANQQPTDYRHSTSDLERVIQGMDGITARAGFNPLTIRSPKGGIRGIDGVPFRLRPSLENAAKSSNARGNDMPILADPLSEGFVYGFATERQCVA